MKTLYRSAFYVTLFSVLQRMLGFLYRIVLSRTLSSEGVGLYQIAISVFMVLLTASSSGIPITVSRLLSKGRAEGKDDRGVLSAGLLLALSITLPTTLVLFLLHTPFSVVFSDKRAETVFLLLLPSLSFSAAHTVLRGFFWGEKDFLPYSVIELVEEIVMIVTGTVLVFHVSDPFEGAKRAAIAVTASNVVSFSLAFLLFFKKGGKFLSPKGFMRPLISSSTPITAMRSGASAIDMLIAFFFPLMLMRHGMTGTEALSAFGVLTGMAVPVLYAPSSLIGSFALVLVPELSEQYYGHDTEALSDSVRSSLSFSALISCLFIPSLFLYGKEAGILLFSNRTSGEYIAYSAYLLLPLSLNMISSGLLNSMQGEKFTFVSFLIGSVFFVGGTLLLAPFIGPCSYLVGIGAEGVVTSVLQIVRSVQKSKAEIKPFRTLFLPLLLTIPPILIGIPLKKVLFLYFGTIPAIFIGCIVLLSAGIALYFIAGFLPKGKLVFPRAKKQELRKKQSDFY
ncbi:MAG: oligosaccharide flippase family protein [Clostridia bacterium]|nr:oligosaccharide flippase family protein [Clostridia bacterium]